MLSTLNIPLSFVALRVNKIAIGNIIKTEIQPPNNAETELSSAKFLPKVLVKK